jgi:16S rRNA (guanine966-N2)-methyltransferase
MSMVQQELPEALVVDLCAGSGALGLEALSRGASQVDFVEQAPASLRVLQANIATLGAEGQSRIVRSEAVAFARGLAAGAYDIAFADPPYESEVSIQLASQWMDTPFAHRLCIEHGANRQIPGAVTTRRYGITALSFLR